MIKLNTRKIDTLKGKIELRNEQIQGYIKEIDTLNNKITAKYDELKTFAALANTHDPNTSVTVVKKLHQSVDLAVKREGCWTKIASLKSENE